MTLIHKLNRVINNDENTKLQSEGEKVVHKSCTKKYITLRGGNYIRGGIITWNA